jgi:hypothetical protein
MTNVHLFFLLSSNSKPHLPLQVAVKCMKAESQGTTAYNQMLKSLKVWPIQWV